MPRPNESRADTGNTLERRNFRVDKITVERRTDSAPKIMGHAAVFNVLSEDLGWFREKIEPGAFKATIGEDDVRALFNHDPNLVLGRNVSGTLRMSEDGVGLAIEIDPPDTQAARDVLVLIERGDVSQMSFAFRVLEESWEYGEKNEPDIRTLKKVRLFDVSPVTYPAYTQTDVALRSYQTWSEKQKKPDFKDDLELRRRMLDLAALS